MSNRNVVTREQWLEARIKLLEKEKQLTRMRDELSAERRQLPWVAVEKSYTFHGPDGQQSLSDLFAGKSQLVVYHFMFDPAWEEGCKSCSFLTDHYQGAAIHLANRDVTLVAVSRAPYDKLAAYKERMGWTHKWVSSAGCDFNFDYHVSFTPEELESKSADYNYRKGAFPASEAPGVSVFCKDEDGAIYHTYSSYGRGLDDLIGTYRYLDMVPKGRDEGDGFPMAWVRRHDEYGD